LLKRAGGATSKELQKTSGWQPHLVANFFTGFRSSNGATPQIPPFNMALLLSKLLQIERLLEARSIGMTRFSAYDVFC
jgi:hypothetical protein